MDDRNNNWQGKKKKTPEVACAISLPSAGSWNEIVACVDGWILGEAIAGQTSSKAARGMGPEKALFQR